MGTCRNFLFTLYSRSRIAGCWFTQERIGIFDPKILFYSATVNGEIAFENSLGVSSSN
jgi:hypothetical protein